MKLGVVIGTVVSSTKVAGMEGLKLLVVHPLNADLSKASKVPFVATDGSTQAGVGDTVTYEGSREGALLHHPRVVPVDHAIVGIVDEATYEVSQ